ncbi:MAG: trypsin-like peptidase domain-containing protein [Candidatus Limnocylindrales bacterium]
MNRWLVRFVALLVVTAVAMGAGFGTAAAAEGKASKVPKTRLTDKPFRGIALITIGDRVVCTGFVVAQNKVATAAHCLVRNASRGDFRLKSGLPRNVRVYRGFSQAFGGSAYRSCGVSKVWAHAKFVKGGKADRLFGRRTHDYAVLTTKCTFPKNAVLRLWATEHGDGQLTAGRRIRIAGYPADPRVKGMSGLTMWRTEGRVRPVGVEPRHLHFTGFVAAGMSGAPVWRTYNKSSPCGRRHCVVGIVTECAINERGLCQQGLRTDRLGVRITPQVKQLLKRK